jgi:hypothetical protein
MRLLAWHGTIAEGGVAERGRDSRMTHTLEVFLYLQLLDFMTTMIGMRIGLGEASPFVRALMQLGPAAGLALSKLLAFALVGVCIWLNKKRLMRWINYWYAGLVLWNTFLIFGVLR